MSELSALLESIADCAEALRGLEGERAEIPRTVEALEAEIQAGRERIDAARESLESAERTRREKEAELADTEERRSKHQGQTALVKTNHEYTALLSEIENETAKIGKAEEEILLAMEESDRLRSVLAEEEKSQQQSQREIEARIVERKARLVEVEQQLVVRVGEHETLIERLDPAGQKIYTRARATNGLGVARIADNVCQGCHRDVPFETINRVLSGELHACAHCFRILLGPEK